MKSTNTLEADEESDEPKQNKRKLAIRSVERSLLVNRY